MARGQGGFIGRDGGHLEADAFNELLETVGRTTTDGVARSFELLFKGKIEQAGDLVAFQDNDSGGNELGLVSELAFTATPCWGETVKSYV